MFALAETPKSLTLVDYQPKSRLSVPTTEISGPYRPFIDAHNHLGPDFGGGWSNRPVGELLDRLDEAQVTTYVDLDGGWGEAILDQRLRKFKQVAPERFCMFGGVDWTKWPEEGDKFGENSAKRFRAQTARGAQGLKIWKNFGLHVRDQNQNLVAIDDPRLDPVWAICAELNLPVLIHIADPVAFFDPVNSQNERWEELHAHPDWQFAPPFPAFATLIEAFARLIRCHPNTTFIGAHVGCYSENLAWVSALLDECPNFHVDISARISELGRQPYSAKRFFQRHADRILFGIDAGPDLASYQIYARFLETEDEYFDYGSDVVPGQGRWRIYGLGLPRDVLDKIYFDNADRLLLQTGTITRGA